MSDLKELVSILTLNNFHDDALDPARECLNEGLNNLREEGVSPQRYLRQHWNYLADKEGLIDAWLGALIFITFAQGIAVGQGRKDIQMDDIYRARDNYCDGWPACYTMRLRSSIAALEHLAGDDMAGRNLEATSVNG